MPTNKRTSTSAEVYIPADGSAPASLIVAATDQGFLVAKDSIFNVIDFLSNQSVWAFRAINECEKELDKIERTVDGIFPKAITHVSERRARELLACSRVITELERIADLNLSAAHQLRGLCSPLPLADKRDLLRMAAKLRTMMDDVHTAMTKRDLSFVSSAIHVDREIDTLRSAIFHRHLQSRNSRNGPERVSVLFATQAIERAGDQATNIAEEAYRLISGDTLRHMPVKEKKSRLNP